MSGVCVCVGGVVRVSVCFLVRRYGASFPGDYVDGLPPAALVTVRKLVTARYMTLPLDSRFIPRNMMTLIAFGAVPCPVRVTVLSS